MSVSSTPQYKCHTRLIHVLWEDSGRGPNSILGTREAFTEELMSNPNPNGQGWINHLNRRKGREHFLLKRPHMQSTRDWES